MVLLTDFLRNARDEEAWCAAIMTASEVAADADADDAAADADLVVADGGLALLVVLLLLRLVELVAEALPELLFRLDVTGRSPPAERFSVESLRGRCWRSAPALVLVPLAGLDMLANSSC